jgi:hypothetical protein
VLGLVGLVSMLRSAIVRVSIGTVAVPRPGIALSIVWITVRRSEQIVRYVVVIVASNEHM